MAQKLNKTADEVIEEDEIIEVEEEYTEVEEDGASSFIQNYSKWIMAGLALVLLIVVFIMWKGSRNASNEVTAQEQMVEPAQIYDQVMLGQAPDSLLFQAINGMSGIKGFAGIASDYGNTPSGNLAHYYLGTAYLKLGQIDKAIEALENFDKGDNMVSATAYAALGAAYEEKGEWDKAAENYEEAARSPEENAFTTPMHLMSAARVYESAKKTDEALEIYKRIKKQYPNSEEARTIDKYIGRITAGKAEE